MSSSKSSQKREGKNSFKKVTPFELFYQLTYMSAISAAGVGRARTFELAAVTTTNAAPYFAAINTLVQEFRYEYPEACRRLGVQSKSENMRSFLLRLSDALRSGEPLADFLTREAEVQGQDYHNRYERDLEALKQWTNAFSSIVISVALIIIVQVISSMIYSTDITMMSVMVVAGIAMAGMGTWIIYRSAPREAMVVRLAKGSAEQQRAMRLFRMLVPLAFATAAGLALVGAPVGLVFIAFAGFLVPIGIISMRSDKKVVKQDEEFSTFLRSTGGMATASGTTLKQALTRIDLSSFPMLEDNIKRLSTRLEALIEPELCWRSFGNETGSRLISDVTEIFYNAVRMGGDPERVGYLCSLFTSKTVQLRAKRKLIAGTFTGLTTVMHAVVAGLMLFVLSIVQNFAAIVAALMPSQEELATSSGKQFSLGMAEFSAADLQFLANVTLGMIVALGIVAAVAIIVCSGGNKLKAAFYVGMTAIISGVCYLAVPPLVANILKS
jgi:archaeal flagellar protein FlaJ